MVGVDQLEALIEFMECHKEMALGHLNRSKEGRSQNKRLWEECATMLNSVSADCVRKTDVQWRMYYNEYKSKLMRKIKLEKAEATATGGGPSKKTPLTPLQERLYNILGRDFGEPLPGIRHNPLSQRDEVVEVEVEESEVIVPEVEVAAELTYDVIPLVRSQSVEQLLATDPCTSRDLPVVATPDPDPISQATPAAPRRRRRRRRSQMSRQCTENEPALHQATERLEAMERLNAEATRELAQATQRQAAALESICDVLKEAVNHWKRPRNE